MAAIKNNLIRQGGISDTCLPGGPGISLAFNKTFTNFKPKSYHPTHSGAGNKSTDNLTWLKLTKI